MLNSETTLIKNSLFNNNRKYESIPLCYMQIFCIYSLSTKEARTKTYKDFYKD